MEEWRLISGAIGLFIVVAGFIFGWGWKIIKDVERSLADKISALQKEKITVHDDLYNLIRANAKSISERASMKYVDETFTRKDTHSLEFKQIMGEMRDIKETLNSVLKNIIEKNK